MIVIGIDAHKRTHTLVAVNPGGSKLAEKTVDATSAGHAVALHWAVTKFGRDLLWGVEDNRSVTGLLEQDLAAAQMRVVRVPPTLMARSRASARTYGKSDAIDAIAVARAAQREPDLPIARHDPDAWELKLLVDRRDDLVLQRVAVLNRLGTRLHQIDPTYLIPRHLDRANARKALGEHLAVQSGLMAELARQELADIGHYSETIDDLTARIIARVHDLGSTLPDLRGCAELTAAKFISETGDMSRFRSEAAFATYIGIAPAPQWSGATKGRLRLSHSGNRSLNAALHGIARVQISKDCPGRTYYRRRRSEGDSGAKAFRCLKRRICRVVYNRLRDDYQRRQQRAVAT